MGEKVSHQWAMRWERHYGDRLFRCFVHRPPNVDGLLRRAVQSAPDRTAVVEGSRRVSYRELDDLVERVATNLFKQGIEKGDRIALVLGNCIEFIVVTMAAARLGAVIVPLNIRQSRSENEYMLNSSSAKAILFDLTYVENIPPADRVPKLKHRFVIGGNMQGADDFELLLKPGRAPIVPVTDDDVFAICYTSGTTGRPKGAMLTNLGMATSVLHFEQGMGLRDGDVTVLALPASHAAGLIAGVLVMVHIAGTNVLMQDFKARTFLDLAEKERMTYVLLVPAMYSLLLREETLPQYDLSRWRVASYGAAPMPTATIHELERRIPNLALINIYGSTETATPVTIMPPELTREAPDSIGKVVPCCDLLVMDSEGQELPPGSPGELWIKGPITVPGYWQNPEATAKSFIGGYWRSGDIGSIDENGFVYLLDRTKDMINRGGYKVYGIEVENVLANHPDVLESGVVAGPDPILGEVVHAFIVARNGAIDVAELKVFCARRLADYKIPDRFTFLSERLPRNPSGKIEKAKLRELANMRDAGDCA